MAFGTRRFSVVPIQFLTQTVDKFRAYYKVGVNHLVFAIPRDPHQGASAFLEYIINWFVRSAQAMKRRKKHGAHDR